MQNIKKKVSNWYESQPFFAKTYTEICLMLSFLFTFDLISSFHLFYTFEDTFSHLNFWRPLTAMIFLGKLDFTSLLSCLVMFIALKNMQKDKFGKRSYPDFIWLIMLLFLACLTAGTFLDLYFLTEVFIMSLLLICAYEKQDLTFFGNVKLGLKVQNIVFSLLYGVIMAYVEKRQLTYIIGAAIGFTYIILKHKIPKSFINRYLQTPLWLQNWWVTKNVNENQTKH